MDAKPSFLVRFIVIALVLGLVACSSRNTISYRSTNHIARGAAIGSVAGIVVGAASGGSIPAVAAGGAVVGGVLGYLIGTKTSAIYRLAHAGVYVMERGDTVTFVLPSDYYFDVHSPRLKTSAYDSLIDIATVINSESNAFVTISAYTDNVGEQRFKHQLSHKQAKRIAAFLWANGVDFRRLEAVGFGSSHFVARNSYPAGSFMNRRVEIRLQKETDLKQERKEFRKGIV